MAMPALLPISQIACSWSAEELHASAQAPVVEMFCDADVSPLHDDQAADDSNSDVDQVTFLSMFANYTLIVFLPHKLTAVGGVLGRGDRGTRRR